MSTNGRPSLPTGLLVGDNAAWVDAQYRAWLDDPGAVDPSWARLFEQHELPADRRAGQIPGPDRRSIFAGAGGGGTLDADAVMAAAERQAKVMLLVNAFRVRGHTEADIDPLGRRDPQPHPELSLEYYGLGPDDLDVPVSGRGIFGVPSTTTLRHVIARMRRAYCGGFGVEFMNIGDPRRKAWLQERFETVQDRRVMSKAACLKALRQMADAQHFEAMLHRRFPGTKRFSLEGAETLIPLLDDLIEALAPRGIEMILLGMAHRGRLNVLANIVDKPVSQILAEFEDRPTHRFAGSGDVKYHLGYTHEHTTTAGQEVVLSLAFNPSHLEAVDPVVEGRCRAVQDRRADVDHARSLAILVHGDAAFAGQGLVAETLNLSGLSGYRTGGTIHVIVNNQIGFTTAPRDARSTDYCTDVARMLQVPIFHVNGEDPDAVATVAALAAEWRQTFHSDCVIDMYCYRKYGHNEGDEPSFTQPLMYDNIRSRKSPLQVYADVIARRYDDIDDSEIQQVIADSRARLDAILEEPGPAVTDSYQGNPNSPLGRVWSAYRQGASVHDPVDTTFDRAWLTELLITANTLPDDFHAHRKIERLLSQRRQIARGERPVDWAVGEQAAYASLVASGHPVRLSGQDSGRGTFSHRHAVLTDVQTGRDHTPLCHLTPDQARFQVYDSMLSEAGVLGFEFGYTLDQPETLVLWEAQFGDFANGAQIIIDNFIMATEQKWDRCSGLVMLLPHGYEGQGPEHSSARLERFLQLCAEDNIIVANCTTPASFFHLLRRQALWMLRKPLIHLSPKSLLRHPRCTSTLDELASGRFQRVIEDPEVTPEEARRLVFCSGKVFYDLQDARGDRRDVSIARLEQLHPFPADRVQDLVRRAGAGAEIVWCQEEPRNMGAWPMMDEWMTDALGERPTYAGRPPAAAPATGSPRKHRAEQAALLTAALDGAAHAIPAR